MKRLENAEAAVGRQLLSELRAATGSQLARAVTEKHSQLDELALIWTQVGEQRRATEILSLLAQVRGRRPQGEGAAPLPQDFRVADALSTIVTHAQGRSIVLLNESHHQPVHRAFAQRVAIELRKLGYKYLAVETLSNFEGIGPIRAIERRTGYYSSEPVFGEFLRNALHLGYELIAYEWVFDPDLPSAQRSAVRETAQARNIFERTFAKDAGAKVLVLAGYGHIRKSWVPGSQVRQMASHLAELAGTDPLSVDQTSLMDAPASHAPLVAYAQLAGRLAWNAPVVPLSSAGAPLVRGHYVGAVDLQVAHPPAVHEHGRPLWYGTLAHRRAVDIPADLVPRSKRRLVQAFRKGDGPSAVPVDMILLSPGAMAPQLMVPDGEYFLAFEDEGDP